MTHATPRNLLLLLTVSVVLSPAAFELFAEQTQNPGGIHGRADASRDASLSNADDFRRREGTPFEGQGSIQFAGERLTFASDDGTDRLTMLENLALDRVARTVRDTTIRTQWKVYGTVTEYQGANFLILERAITVRPKDDGF